LPYTEINIVEKPNKIDQKIWRLIDDRKYADLLNRHALYFARSDRLGDELEGQKPPPEVILTEKQRKEWAERIHLNPQFLEYINKLDSVTDKGQSK
jgi:hypothetical protein